MEGVRRDGGGSKGRERIGREGRRGWGGREGGRGMGGSRE